MKKDQIKLLYKLYQKIKDDKTNHSNALSSLKKSGILNNDGDISHNYPTIRKYIINSI